MKPGAPELPPLEMWGGVEGSCVRLPDRVDDQLLRTGHHGRRDDLNLLAQLGLRTVRYPVIWRHSAPYDWQWADERLGHLQELGIRPIVGFLHHGCGPLPGGFLDPGFVGGLADFAREFARRYPWVDAYTPVNEPLTTARFSGMYGLWHPGTRDPAMFARILLVECQAIRAAMRAIHAVNPRAQLVQTEDIGKTHSTEVLAYQADFENERRWVSFDLLCGRIVPTAPQWRHLVGSGLDASELESFAQDPCPPDILGMNHYVTSERFLDEQLDKYPADHHGGNGRQAYADVPAVRVRAEGLVGPGTLLRELWERYRRPVAVTEVQLACTREEQVRWLCEAWDAAHEARQAGVPVRAITAWALFGACDWDSLLRVSEGHYENGAFAVTDGVPRETAIAAAVRALATQGSFQHPVLAVPGWWRRPVRFEFPPVRAPRTGRGTAEASVRQPAPDVPALLVVGTRAEMFKAICTLRGLSYRFMAPGGTAFELAPPEGPLPWGVLAEATAPAALLEECQAFGIPWVTLPEKYDEGTVRRALDGLIDAALLLPAAAAR
jgi:dTDP-4-dehydrorhamnose reductase